jgi:hypothetical protein
MNIADFRPRFAAAQTNCAGQRRLARSGRADDQRAGAAFDPAAHQGVELIDATGEPFVDRRRLVLAGDESWKHLEPAAPDHVVVIAAAKIDAPVLDHRQPPALGAVFRIQLLEPHDAMGNGLRMDVLGGAAHVVEQQHGAPAAAEELLHRQDLPAIAQRIPGQQTQFGKRVEDHARRGWPLSTSASSVFVVSDSSTSAGWNIVYCSSSCRPCSVGNSSRITRFERSHPCESATARISFSVSGQRDVKRRLAVADSFEDELHRQRGLAGAGHAFQKVDAMGREPSAQDVVQPANAGAGRGQRFTFHSSQGIVAHTGPTLVLTSIGTHGATSRHAHRRPEIRHPANGFRSARRLDSGARDDLPKRAYSPSGIR